MEINPEVVNPAMLCALVPLKVTGRALKL
jgi:hypothetical protein